MGFRLVVLALRMLVRRLMMLMGGGLVGGSRMLMMLGGRMLGRLRHRRRSYSGYTVSEDSDRGLLQTLERKTFPPDKRTSEQQHECRRLDRRQPFRMSMVDRRIFSH